MKNNLGTLLSQVLITSSDLEIICRDMPNINSPNFGGIYFWNDIYAIDGWRVQKNTVFKQCRVLDDEYIRSAWGFSEEYMINKVKQFINAKNNKDW